jgi:hypothetical protein
MPSAKKKQPDLYTHKILAAVLEFLIAAGADRKDLLAIVEAKLVAVPQEKNARIRKRRSARGDDTVSATVLHRWHRERNLLDTNALPVPLPLYGAAPSVESLVRSEKPSRPPRQIVADMVAMGLLRRAARGKYLPKARVATIRQMHPVLMEHVAKSLVRLLETVQNNTTAASGAIPLIERFTHIPDLPLTRVPEFRAFAQDHGSNFLASVDDWLEARRVRNSPKKQRGVSAGIHVYAYIERDGKRKLNSRAKPA